MENAKLFYGKLKENGIIILRNEIKLNKWKTINENNSFIKDRKENQIKISNEKKSKEKLM